MHWIDPTSLPAVSGEVERFIINPRGDLDGLVLAGNRLVHVPPHLSEAVTSAIRPGDTIRVHGVRPRGADMMAAVSLTAASGQVILDGRPAAQEKGQKGVHDKPKQQKFEAQGTVHLSLFGPKGELRGALLDDGTVLRIGPKEAERVVDLLRPAAVIQARGAGIDTKHGRVIVVSEIAAAGGAFKPVKKPKPEKHAKREKEEPREAVPHD
jgi:hypothetical protein